MHREITRGKEEEEVNGINVKNQISSFKRGNFLVNFNKELLIKNFIFGHVLLFP